MPKNTPKRRVRNVKIKPLTIAQRAYLAALIDGEGAISVTRVNNRENSRIGYFFRPVVHVANTCERVLVSTHKWTGLGKVRRFEEKRIERITWKPRWQWMVWSRQAAQLIRAVLPFLIIKKERARVFLRFCAATRNNNHRGSVGLTDKDWNRQILLWKKMRALNKRGI